MAWLPRFDEKPFSLVDDDPVAGLPFTEQLTKAGADVRRTTEDGSAGTKGLVTSVVEPLLKQSANDELLACDPHGMLDALTNLAARYHIPSFRKFLQKLEYQQSSLKKPSTAERA